MVFDGEEVDPVVGGQNHRGLGRALWVASLGAGVATLGLGLVVLFGWHTDNRTLIQVLPTFVPMQYNTALGFVFSGAALLGLLFDRTLLARIAGGLLLLVGGLTLVEYIGGVDLRIDEMFMEHQVTVKTSHPGRMAPNTAVCFTLLGLAAAVRFRDWSPARRSQFRVILGSCTFGLAVVALSGYFTKLETAYGWGNLTRMAVHTSAGFILGSIGLLGGAWRRDLGRGSRLPRWIPVPIFIAVFTATLCLWQALTAEGARIAQRYEDLGSLSGIATLMLVLGALLALALAMVAWFALRASSRAREVLEANRALEGARERTLSELMESAPDAMIVADGEGKICRWNSKLEDLFGYKKGEIEGMNVEALMPERFRDGAGSQMARYFANPLASSMESQLELMGKRKDESEFPIETGLSPFNEPEGVMTVAAIRDITERKAQEDLLKAASEEAKAANRSKSEFLSHMSHELRTPLNGVLGYAQILQRDAEATEKQKVNLEGIVNCGDHLLSLINDVLDLSKIEAGRIELDVAACDLHKIVESVGDVVRQRAESKDLTFDVEVSSEVPQGILTDAGKLRQILVNLLGNAVKFTAEGGVTLRVAESPRGRLRFDIVDTGVGMNEEEIADIFDPFKQVDAGKAAGGTGLGLAITKRLVERMGGGVSVTSEEGSGSTFSFDIPLKEAEGACFEALEEGKVLTFGAVVLAPGQEVTVLVADDRETNRDILDKMLAAAGFRVVMVDDGDTALEALRKELPDIVLMDVRMPRMNGIEAVKAIRADGSLKELTVIAVTASVFPEFREKAIEEGFDDFLAKPFRTEELMEKLQKHLEVNFVNADGSESDLELAEDEGDYGAVPEEILGRLKEALKIKNLTAINTVADELKKEPETAVFGEGVTKCARGFDFAGLEELMVEAESRSDG